MFVFVWVLGPDCTETLFELNPRLMDPAIWKGLFRPAVAILRKEGFDALDDAGVCVPVISALVVGCPDTPASRPPSCASVGVGVDVVFIPVVRC